MKTSVCFSIFLFIISTNLFAQQYTVNGSATQNDCHCYTLTPNSGTKSGSVWNNIKINLNQSFNFVFTINLGCNDPVINGVEGADGIAFVLQPISTSVGTTGSGLGFGGITPSIGITLDTYQNGSPDNDPVYDHIAIQRNGDLNHTSANNLAGPVTIINNFDNAEDCQDHSLRIIWDATTKTLQTFFDGVPRLSIVNDLVNTTFGGNPLVYWGFTGSTGGLFNLQKFCTALDPNWHYTPVQKRCVMEPITFIDSTITFTPLAKFYWNFGDGSNIDSVNINPTHTYSTAGDYTVTQLVRGADGCEETNTQIVRVGSKPVAGFKILDSCVSNLIQFTDTSKTNVGTINSWYWSFDNGGLNSSLQTPSTQYSSYGLKNIKLAVKSLEGCTSDTLYKTIRIRAQATVDFTFTDSVCLGSPTVFTKNITTGDGLSVNHIWHFDGTSNTVVDNPQYLFTTSGMHTVMLEASLDNNTCGGTKTKTVFVVDKPRAGIKAIAICQGQQIQLMDSSYTTDGIALANGWWDLGNGQFSTALNPVATYSTAGPKTIKHVMYNAKGCKSDTLTKIINVSAKPIAKFGVGPVLCNNNTVEFYDSSLVANGSIAQWSWISNGAVFSTTKTASGLFPAGPNKIGLVVTSNAGCTSDTAFITFTTKTKPSISMTFKDACKLAPINFIANETTNIGITNWQWFFGDGATASGANVTHAYNANGNYIVKLLAQSSEGCFSDTLPAAVKIYGTNAFAGNDTIVAAGQPFRLHASGGLSYLWTTGAMFLNNTTIPDPVGNLTTTQTFRLKAFTPEGCESYAEVTVNVYNGPDIYLPTAFTPNNDGLNDVFRGTFVGIQKFNYMRIFNRWGQQLFAGSNPNDGWNGRYKGAEQVPGTYVVIVSGVDFRGNLIAKKRTFQLLR